VLSFPEELADRAWDNVGLLVGNIEPNNEVRQKEPVVLLTNDLTFAVGEEAIRIGASVIVSYRQCSISSPISRMTKHEAYHFSDPFIFSGYKSISTMDPQQATLLRLASHGIAVYCPHTAMDAAPRGINSWLADILTSEDPKATRRVIKPIANPPEGFEGAGYGLEIRYPDPKPIKSLLKIVGTRLGDQRRIMVAKPPGETLDDRLLITGAAVSAGSGYDVLKGCDASVLVTGEMAHHNALRCTQMGKVVVCVFHSNSERGFLQERLQPLLEEELKSRLPTARVLVSQEDSDPFNIVDVGSYS
jgi:putative NIF3 family GTP cyclohydrolase 1 type 2